MPIEQYDRKSVSTNKDWCTPAKYVDAIQGFLGKIFLDPCSNEHSLVMPIFQFRPPIDGLTREWDYPTVFVNPPFGKDKERGTSIRDWLRKASEANRKHGAEVVVLCPASTNTSHWQEIVFPTVTAICFLKEPRVKFFSPDTPSTKGAPMACALLYWGRDKAKFAEHFRSLGTILVPFDNKF